MSGAGSQTSLNAALISIAALGGGVIGALLGRYWAAQSAGDDGGDEARVAPPAASETGSVRPRVYLGGPEVFLPREAAVEVARRKREACAALGLEGVSPADISLDVAALGVRGDAAADLIAAKDEALMRSCHMGVCCVTPFRGPSMDVGTAYEMGVLRGAGKPVFAFTNAAQDLRRRTLGASGAARDARGMHVEDFGQPENLMLAAAVRDCGGRIAVPASDADAEALDRAGRLYSDLATFEAAARQAAEWWEREVVSGKRAAPKVTAPPRAQDFA